MSKLVDLNGRPVRAAPPPDKAKAQADTIIFHNRRLSYDLADYARSLVVMGWDDASIIGGINSALDHLKARTHSVVPQVRAERTAGDPRQQKSTQENAPANQGGTDGDQK